ncbi:MAG: hypothetical protein Q7T89_04860 [Anaerolineales bacterium]|nr:hypothetical protein [Anaerolineales bacterium]
MSKPTFNFFSLSIWLSATFSAFVLAIYAYLGTFSRHLADDYCAVDFVKKDFFTALWINYTNVSDRFSNFMLITFSEVVGPRTVAVLPALMIILWVIGIAWLLYEASRFSGQAWDKFIILTLTLLFVFFALLQAPNRFQILYWRSSMSAHFAPLVFMPYLASSILRSIFAAEKKPTAFWVYPLIFFASFILGGFSEPTVMVLISLLALAIFSTWLWMKRPTRGAVLSLLIWSFAGAALALVVMAISPANAFRLGNAAPPTLPILLSRTFGYGFDFILNSFRTLPLPTLFTVLMPFLVFYNLYALPTPVLTPIQRKRAMIMLAVIPILSYLLIVASFLPSVYGQSFPVERARFSGQVSLVAGLMIEAALLGSLSAQFRSRIVETLNFKLISAILLAVAAFYPLRAAWISLADVPVYRARAEMWDEREAQIYNLREQGQTDLMIIQFDGLEGVKELDVNANHWVNRCAAKYYKVDSIRAITDK